MNKIIRFACLGGIALTLAACNQTINPSAGPSITPIAASGLGVDNQGCVVRNIPVYDTATARNRYVQQRICGDSVGLAE